FTRHQKSIATTSCTSIDDCAALRRFVLQESARPGNEVLPVRSVGVSAVVLPPGQLSIQQSDVPTRHFLGAIVIGSAETPGAEQPEHGTGRDGRHVAALLVEPLPVSFLGDTR